MTGTYHKGASREELVKSTQKGQITCTDETLKSYFEVGLFHVVWGTVPSNVEGILQTSYLLDTEYRTCPTAS